GTYTTTVKRIRYAGKLTMRAKINGTFLSSSTEVNFDAGQTIKLAEEPNLKTFGDPSFTITDIGSRVFNTDTPLTLPVKLIVKSSSSEVCDINNSKEVTIKSAGDCTLVASQSGGDITDEAIANFTQSPKTSNTTTFGAAADVEKTIEIKKANQTITVTNTPTTAFIGDIFPVTAISDSTLPVTIVPSPTTICTLDSTNKVTIKAAGTCKLTADQAGNDNYKAAATVIYNIKVSADSITFPTISDKTYGSAPFSVTATSSSGANVSLSSETTNVCAVSGTTVTLVAVGTCKLKATSGSISNTAEFKVKKNASQLASESIGEVIASGTGKVTTAQLKAMGVKNVKADKDYTDAIKKGTYANINPTQAELQTVIDKANSDDNKSGGSTSPLWLLTLGFVALFRRKEQS
ncbi:MAG: GlyGly-CTERM sorting domain-containing protein, partial [Methylococcaceae bacterium]